MTARCCQSQTFRHRATVDTSDVPMKANDVVLQVAFGSQPWRIPSAGCRHPVQRYVVGIRVRSDRNRCKVGPRPLNSGDPFALQVSVSCASLDAGADALFVSRSFCVQPFSCRGSNPQLLMSLMATMMAMMAMRTTRMIRR